MVGQGYSLQPVKVAANYMHLDIEQVSEESGRLHDHLGHVLGKLYKERSNVPEASTVLGRL